MPGQQVVKRAHSNCDVRAISKNPVKRFLAKKIAVKSRPELTIDRGTFFFDRRHLSEEDILTFIEDTSHSHLLEEDTPKSLPQLTFFNENSWFNDPEKSKDTLLAGCQPEFDKFGENKRCYHFIKH